MLIYSDQHRADAVGAMGNPGAITPNLDALASEGITFGRCYTNAPLCRPARASLLTGAYPRQHGVPNNFHVVDPCTKSHVRRMRQNGGYCTAVVGKTHLHKGRGHLDRHGHILDEMGYEYTHELTGPVHVRDLRSAYTDWLLSRQKGRRTLKKMSGYLAACMNTLWRTPWETPAPDDFPWLIDPGDHIDTYTGRTAADWIRRYHDTRPFYLQVCFPGPHNPYDSPRRYRALYEKLDVELPPGNLRPPGRPQSALVEMTRQYQDISKITPEQHRALQIAYYAKVTLIDEAIGEVLSALGDRDLLENTWIIYTSDHGDMLGDHLLAQKGVFYEEAVRVPLIVRPPKIPRAARVDGIVQQVDVTATVLDIAGLENDTEGRSLVTLDSSGEVPVAPTRGRELVISENRGFGMAFDGRHKLVVHQGTKQPAELYDLEADPGENENMVTRKQTSGPVEARLLEAYLEAVPADEIVRPKRRARRRSNDQDFDLDP